MFIRRELIMDTLVTIRVVPPGAEDAIHRAFGWFHEIERRCTRFDPESELMQLTSQIGVPVPVSPTLFQCVQFAVHVSQETEGAFDPTIGYRMESLGYNREYRTGRIVSTGIASGEPVTFRDLRLDPRSDTIELHRPLILDLGAVAKGLAIDMAARELQPFGDFCVDAGGDLYLGGRNPEGAPWRAGIRDPRNPDSVIQTLHASNQAVCTSGDYERGRHILDPRTGQPAASAASVTVVAPNALLADALSTAAFVLGPHDGMALLERMGVEGMLITPDSDIYQTQGLSLAA
jgi:thiamine biosynthesis lipoprotein